MAGFLKSRLLPILILWQFAPIFSGNFSLKYIVKLNDSLSPRADDYLTLLPLQKLGQNSTSIVAKAS
jgi:hypothetical protein